MKIFRFSVLIICFSVIFSFDVFAVKGSNPGGGGTGATVNDSITDSNTTSAPSENAVYDALALKLNIANPPMTGDATLTDATPTFGCVDSDASAGTCGIFGDSTGVYDITLTMGVRDSTGARTPYFDLNGVTETVDIKKTMTFLNAGVVAQPAATNDNHTIVFWSAYGRDNAGDIVPYNIGTCTNNTPVGTNLYPDCSIDNVNLSLPPLTSLNTTGTVTGLTNVVSVGNTEGVHDGSDDQAVMTDSGETLTVDAYIGMTVYNITDGSSGTITDNDGTTITATLAGGTQNDWDTNDVWAVGPGPRQSNSMFFISASTTIIHPATAGYTAGYFVVGAVTVKVDPASASMTMNFSADGTYTDPGAGDEIDGDGTSGDFIIFLNQSATEAHSIGVNGTWADGGAS